MWQARGKKMIPVREFTRIDMTRVIELVPCPEGKFASRHASGKTNLWSKDGEVLGNWTGIDLAIVPLP
jgi:hypothetical protein